MLVLYFHSHLHEISGGELMNLLAGWSNVSLTHGESELARGLLAMQIHQEGFPYIAPSSWQI